MKIGITYTGSEEKQQNYHNWLRGGTGEYEFVTLHHNEGQPNLDEYAGILFSGGTDVHPDFYNASVSYPNAPGEFDLPRDEFEKELFFAASKRGVPILGICRGMQLINVLSGGTLKQDLGEPANELHRGEPADKQHRVTVKPGTQLMEILSGNAGKNGDVAGKPGGEGFSINTSTEVEVNSAHHQVINEPAPGMLISSYSADGHAEALERKSPLGQPFLLGVQWHPERMFRFGLEDTPASAAIRGQFIQEINKYTNRHENS
ncbi:MAG: gamma-glutamyl-gamma-aminobutyrate hydrolase family protein [Chitinophagaceae bacterium]